MMRVTLGNNHFHQYQFFKFYAGKVSHISSPISRLNCKKTQPYGINGKVRCHWSTSKASNWI